MLGASNASCSKQTAVHTEQEKLADYVRRVANDRQMTYREVARRSGVSSPTISDILSGKTRAVKVETLQALAKGLQVPEDDIFDVARGKKKGNLSETRTAFFGAGQELSADDWEEVIAIARCVIDQKSRRRRKFPVIDERDDGEDNRKTG
jgi:transcriptional regulator with XRE-family HTH domain